MLILTLPPCYMSTGISEQSFKEQVQFFACYKLVFGLCFLSTARLVGYYSLLMVTHQVGSVAIRRRPHQ